MTYFYAIDTTWQMQLLVFSLFTLLILATGVIVLFRQKSAKAKQIAQGVLLVLNLLLFLLMQMDNTIDGSMQTLQFAMPYMVPGVCTACSLCLGVWIMLSETGNRKRLHHTSIKEAFDNLPTGVCFFRENGLPVLCNRAMHAFSFAVTGKDVQVLSDLAHCMEDAFLPIDDVQKEGNLFTLADHRTWQLEQRAIAHQDGTIYQQFIATDVTDLYTKRLALAKETEQLKKVQTTLQKLSANVVTMTREEEILNTKMRVHDTMGRCLVQAQTYLQQDSTAPIPDSVAFSWKQAVSALKYQNDVPDEDMLNQVKTACASVNVAWRQTGDLPQDASIAYVFTCAIRECLTNAVRYANATALYAVFAETETEAKVTVTNNGHPPKAEIVEGGGLSTLRRRVERAGGTMELVSLPEVILTVTIPKRKAGIV